MGSIKIRRRNLVLIVLAAAVVIAALIVSDPEPHIDYQDTDVDLEVKY